MEREGVDDEQQTFGIAGRKTPHARPAFEPDQRRRPCQRAGHGLDLHVIHDQGQTLLTLLYPQHLGRRWLSGLLTQQGSQGRH